MTNKDKILNTLVIVAVVAIVVAYAYAVYSTPQAYGPIINFPIVGD